MKFYHLTAIVCLLFIAGCDKEDPVPVKTPEEILKKEVFDVLASKSDLTEFTAAFNDLELETADIAGGITLFAPVNGNSGGRLRSGEQSEELTPEILKGHIIKGLIKASDLDDGDTFEALDGRTLVVSVDGDEISINGVSISAKDLATGDEYVIHKVQEIIGDAVVEDPASLTVTVWNSLKWTVAKPKGEAEPGVTVSFYTSREAYAEGNAAYSGQTDAAGKITFSEAEAGTNYFIVAEKDDLSSIFQRSPEPSGGIYTGLLSEGLFQTQEEIDNAAFQSDAAPGNFRWQDLNGDGIINNDDKTAVPQQEASAVPGETQVDVIIGYVNNDAMIVHDGADALETLQAARNLLNTFHKTLVMSDGILSDDAACPGSDPNWCAIDNFSLEPPNSAFTKTWIDGYNAIAQLNMLLRDVPGLTFGEKDFVLAEAKGLRAYIYLQLATYFGGVPIPEGIRIGESDSRKTTDEVYDFVKAELQAIVGNLPSAPSSEREKLTTGVAKTLLARVALLKQDYSGVQTLTNDVLQSQQYSLMGTSDAIFTDADNSEIIWDFSFSLPAGFQDYFYGRTFCPAFRLAEIYLMNAEAQIELNNLEAGRQSLDMVRARRELSPSSGVTLGELRSELRDTWRIEMSKEGNRFSNLVRWGTAETTLGASGYRPNHTLLPIPQLFIDNYFNVFQNAGY